MRITSPSFLANAIRNARIERGLTQKELGDLIGMKQPTVSSFETRPEKTSLTTLFRIMAALELSIEVADRDDKKETGWAHEW